MNNGFSSEALRREIYGMKPFSYIGGREKGLSYPLIKEADQNLSIVFFVFTVTDEMPGAFVLCKNGADPEYLEYEEGLNALGIREEEIEPVQYPGKDNAKELLPGELYGMFDEAYGDGTVDKQKYAKYLDLVTAQSPIGLRRYLKLFY